MTEVVVDNGQVFVSEETAIIATEAANRAKQWAEEAEQQANLSADDANLAHDWAVKMDGKVAGEDYSAKYYAEQAADVPYNGVIATGGTTKRTLQDHFGDILNVKDFGAKGDGVTNDTAAFNAAGRTGKLVYVPAGTYNLQRYINYHNFIIGRGVSFNNKALHYEEYDNTYKKSIVFSMPRVFDDYTAARTACGTNRLVPQGFTYDDEGNCYIFYIGGDVQDYAVLVKLDYQYDYVGWIYHPYSGGGETPILINKNNHLYYYNRGAGYVITQYDITNVQWNGDYVTGTDTPIKGVGLQYDYDNGVWYISSTDAYQANRWQGRNWIYKYDDDFNYLGCVKLPEEFVGFPNTAKYHYDMTKTQGFRVKNNEFYISNGLGRRFTLIPDYKPCFDWGLTKIAADGHTLLKTSFLNSEKFNTYLTSLGFDEVITETEGCAKHPDGSIHNFYTGYNDIFIIREFDDAGVDFSDIASSYTPVNMYDLQNRMYPVSFDSNDNKQYLDVVSGAKITQVSDFLNMMYNLDLQKLLINTGLLNVSGADGLTLPNNSICRLTNLNNEKVMCEVLPDDTTAYIDNIFFTRTPNTQDWTQVNQIKFSTNFIGLKGADTGLHWAFMKYIYGSTVYRTMSFTEGGIYIGEQSTADITHQNLNVFLSNTSKTATRKVLTANYSYVYPGEDNVVSLGAASYLWKEIFCANATINTSDERLKQDIEDIDERVFRAWEKVDFKQFRFRLAVNEKGENARIHFGLIAQQVKEAFESEGLDGFKYGLLCYDEWEDEYEDIEVTDKPAEYDEEGNVISPAEVHTEKKLVRAAGNAYGIRYGEALALECAYQRKKLDNLLNNGNLTL